MDANCTVVGIPGRVIHQSGERIDPLAHSALPDAEANVIRNLMERIDELDAISILGNYIKNITGNKQLKEELHGESQNLRDREIIEFLEGVNRDPNKEKKGT